MSDGPALVVLTTEGDPNRHRASIEHERQSVLVGQSVRVVVETVREFVFQEIADDVAPNELMVGTMSLIQVKRLDSSPLLKFRLCLCKLNW